MNQPSSPFRLFDLWRRRADDTHLSEPADLGTAFGLEMSLLPEEDSSTGRRSAAADGWWQRLTRRGAA